MKQGSNFWDRKVIEPELEILHFEDVVNLVQEYARLLNKYNGEESILKVVLKKSPLVDKTT